MTMPWMPMYWGDLLSSTSHLTMNEMGAYVRLMGHYWCLKGLPVSEDTAQVLERCNSIAGAKTDDDRAAVAFVLPEFFEKTGDSYRHRRLEREMIEAEERHSASIKAGRLGGLASARQKRERTSTDGQPTLDITVRIRKSKKQRRRGKLARENYF